MTFQSVSVYEVPPDIIECGHPIVWRWASVGQDGAFCAFPECWRVYPVQPSSKPPRRILMAGSLGWPDLPDESEAR